MLCYKDVTFCPFYKKCVKGNSCKRALTKEVKEEARKWWSTFKSTDAPPIAVYTDKPNCFKNIIKK